MPDSQTPTTEFMAQAMQHWVSDVIVKYNFCPFARAEVERNAVRYQQSAVTRLDDAMAELLLQCQYLDANPQVATTLLSFAPGFSDFYDFLDLIAMADRLIAMEGYEGVYQIAHFHPQYCFADADTDDAENYSNRAPFATLHIIREADMAQALEHYDEPESIPERNIAFAERKGAAFWQNLLQQCMDKAKSR